MRKAIILAAILLAGLWSLTDAAYYAFKPRGEFNYNNTGTQPDSVRLIDWTVPDTFYHASGNMHYVTGGGFYFDSTVAARGNRNMTWEIYYLSGAIRVRENFVYEVGDSVGYAKVTDKTGFALSGTQVFNNTGTWAGNITGSLSGSVGSVTGAVGSVTGNVGGNVTGSVGSVLALGNNVITAASINSNAFTSAKFASDFLHEIALRSDSGVTISLTDADIDTIIQGIVDAGIILDTAALRANIAATPMIVGTNNDKTGYGLASGAITSAVIAASGSHAIALASDSGGVVPVDYNLISSTAYDYFTYGNREDVFKGGSGAGPDTTIIVVLSSADSTPVVGASVSYFIGASKLTDQTDSVGSTLFGALPGTYTAIAAFDNRYTSTVSITAGSTDTIFMSAPTIPDPTDTALTGVYGYIKNLQGQGIQGVIVSVRNQGRDIQVGNVIVSQYEVYDTTDAAGFWSMNIYPTATLGGSTYKYTFTQYRGSQQVIRKQDITVPDQASWQFDF